MTIDIQNIKKNLEYIGKNFNSDSRGYNRIAFSKEETAAIDWLEGMLKKQDIKVRRDSVGNLFARIGPENKTAYAFGSHLDTVKYGGLYDGALGVIVGLECLLHLNRNNVNDNAYELICFVGEEGNPLGGTFGSRLITGQIDIESLDDKLIESQNMSKDILKKAHNTLDDYSGFIELHIEQGTVLESNDNKIGVVTSIAGIVRNHIKVKGSAGHSGTIPMNNRKDALVMASEIVKYINTEVKRLGEGTVATVGQFEVKPNVVTIVPGEVDMTFEVRSGSSQILKTFPNEIIGWIEENYDVDITPGVVKPTNKMSKNIIDRIEKAGETLGIGTMGIISGANHDTNTLAPFIETGMIFVPSIDGISHNPLENSDWQYIEDASNIMLETLKSFE